MKAIHMITVVAVAGTIISGGLWMIKSQSKTLEGLETANKFKKATFVLGGIAILGVGANYLMKSKLVKDVVK
jgi:hypothetical protein